VALFRNGDALQRASELTVVVLDKTGTITEGKPKVVEQWLVDSSQQTLVAQVVSALEARANHPLADALIQHCQNHLDGNDKATLDEFESLIGLG